MAVHTGLSKSLYVNTNANVIDQTEETSIMLLLLNAIAEAKNKNIKKANVEFNQSFIESKENDNLFLSKLLELTYQDLEILFLCLCGPDKNRRLSKQHEKRSSLKKKRSVGDLSYSNGAFESETKAHYQSNSLGRKRSPINLQDENTQGRKDLRKAFYLRRDFLKPDLHDETFQSILTIHLKVENYYPCVILFTEQGMKPYNEHLINSLDDSQKFKLYQLCIFVATNITRKQILLTSIEITSCIEHCRLACNLLPNEEKPHELLCRIYRKANETPKAMALITNFFDEVKKDSVIMFVQKLMCLTDINQHDIAATICEKQITANEDTKELTEFHIIRSLLNILNNDTATGLEIFTFYSLDINKSIIVGVLEQLRSSKLQHILQNIYVYIEEQLELSEHNEENEEHKERALDNIKRFLLLISQLLAIKNRDDLSYSKLHLDCLHVCGEYESAQTYLVRLVKEHPNERLPMIYLANLRLKHGSYVAATEDFRTLYTMWGSHKLSADLATLPLDDRKEIARVHRLHGFRYLKQDDGFQESVECFSVAICAIGGSATGLLLSRGLCHMHLNDFEKANEDFDLCLENDDGISAALFARAVLYASKTHVEEAIVDFRRAFALDSNACQQCLTKLPLEQVLTFVQMLSQYIKQQLEIVMQGRQNQLSKVNKCSLVSIELDNEVLRYNEFLCKVFPTNIDHISTYIECLYTCREYGAALYETNNATKLYPNSDCFYAWQGLLLIQQRKFDDAISQLRHIKEANDDVIHVILCLDKKSQRLLFDKVMRKANSASEKDKHGEAVIYYNIAGLLNGKNVDALRGRMYCYHKIGDIKKWLSDLNKVIQLQPLTHELCLRARYFHTKGEDLRACEDYILALEMEEQETVDNITTNSNGEEVIELFHKCAWYMIELEKPKEVYRLCEAGLKFDPTHKGLRQLREKTRSHVSKCVIQ